MSFSPLLTRPEKPDFFRRKKERKYATIIFFLCFFKLFQESLFLLQKNESTGHRPNRIFRVLWIRTCGSHGRSSGSNPGAAAGSLNPGPGLRPTFSGTKPERFSIKTGKIFQLARGKRGNNKKQILFFPDSAGKIFQRHLLRSGPVLACRSAGGLGPCHRLPRFPAPAHSPVSP